MLALKSSEKVLGTTIRKQNEIHKTWYIRVLTSNYSSTTERIRVRLQKNLYSCEKYETYMVAKSMKPIRLQKVRYLCGCKKNETYTVAKSTKPTRVRQV